MRKLQTVVYREELEILPGRVTDIPISNYRRCIHVAPHRDPQKANSWLEVSFEAFVHEPAETMNVRFHVHGTGDRFDHETHGNPPMNLGVTHLGTVATHRGSLIWHVYVEYPIRGA
ncbi:DUF7352 domain-containing protein [Rhodococcoides fascians]|uniref:DUF7352 domain-containing protein n=1 Tax=Rhodococcoides fascians TaxID=1828 RepID=UPI00050BE713|nr:hypothetical protein [Rhodococcus fascians]